MTVGTVELIQGLLLAFALIVILMPPYIRLLQAIGFGKRIRQEGPESHFVKEGTPTMGGLLIVVVVLGIYFFLQQPDAATFAPLAALAGVGALGAFDDYLNARTGEGIRARQKLIWLTVVAFVAAWQIQQTYEITAIPVPFVGPVEVEPWRRELRACQQQRRPVDGHAVRTGARFVCARLDRSCRSRLAQHHRRHALPDHALGPGLDEDRVIRVVVHVDEAWRDRQP